MCNITYHIYTPETSFGVVGHFITKCNTSYKIAMENQWITKSDQYLHHLSLITQYGVIDCATISYVMVCLSIYPKP